MTARANVWTIAKKELRGYFGSPVAVIFLATFLAVTLFALFWYEKFFARGVADLRPMFEWLPLLLILLVGALAMRLWSEERKLGTLEILMTLPVPRWQLVAGKFLAGMLLITLALVLTAGVPITVSQMGDLDFGPVIGGYLAALLLAAAYLAIGMCVSAMTADQIVALVGTVAACAVLYLPGSGPVADLAGGWGDFLRHLGSGSRFASIARGVIDVRDLAYYLGLVAVFLALNVWLLGRLSWSSGPRARARHRSTTLAIALVAANALALNLWLAPVTRVRLDVTQHDEYSLSDTTKQIVRSLPEPLLIRAYLSKKTHPALAPVLPQIEDLLEEYRIAGNGRVRVEVVDPSGDDAAIDEARERYEITPLPLPFAERLGHSVVNVYFHVLVEYGDQRQVIGLDDLIEVDALDIGDVIVRLENFEYDVTRTIRTVAAGFNSVDAMFASLSGKVELIAFIGPELPKPLTEVATTLETVAKKLADQGGAKLAFTRTAPATQAEAEQAFAQYGVKRFRDMFSGQTYYYELVVRVGDRFLRLDLPETVTEAALEESLIATIKRVAPGFTTLVGLWVPPAPPARPPMMEGMPPQEMPPPQSFEELERHLAGDYEVRPVQLDGPIGNDISALVLAGPANLGPDEVAAVDQFVMRGGALVVLAGRHRLAPSRGGIAVEPITTGLEPLLTKWGITLGDEMVIDPAGEKIAVPFQRVPTAPPEVMQIRYPYFPRVDGDRVAHGSLITAGVPGMIMHLAAPVTATGKLGDEPRTAENLLRSSGAAWLGSEITEPDLEKYPEVGFGKPPDLAAAKVGSQVLAVAVRGGLPSGVAADPGPDAGSGSAMPPPPPGEGAGASPSKRERVHSPPDTRIVVFGSSAFASDDMMGLARRMRSQLAEANLQLVHNAVDWAVADTELLGIRARSSAARTLTVAEDDRGMWEMINYGIAIAGLGFVIAISILRRRRIAPLARAKEVAP